MSRFGFKSDIYHGDVRLGELHTIPVLGQKFYFPNNEFRIHSISPRSQRCPPISILQTISQFSVRCKLESSLPTQQSELVHLHASCIQNLQTLVSVVEDEEMHLVAMRSKSKKPLCFWCFSVPLGLYDTCLRMLNTRCLAIVFDLDETLIVANTMTSFDHRMEALRGRLIRETDPRRVSRMSAELRRYSDDRKLLRQYAETDCVEDNGKVFSVRMEEVPPLGDGHKKVVRPVIRMKERNIVLTRINPEIRDTSVLVRLRPAWEDFRRYLNAKERKRFEVYVCSMAERDYALEMWRLLDPEAHLIGSKQILDRVICVKSGSRKSLLNVFQNGRCHPNMAMVIDDRSKVWEDMDQPRVHVVPAFTPYYAPQAEMANPVALLCIARNVACNVRGHFFKEFDEDFLQRISRVYYEDEVVSLPHPPDVSNCMIFKDPYSAPKSNANAPISEGMNDVRVEQRLNQFLQDGKSSDEAVTQPKANHVEFRQKTSQPPSGIISNVICPESSRPLIPSQEPGLLGPPVRHGPDIRSPSLVEPPLILRRTTQTSPSSLLQPFTQQVKEDNTIRRIHQKIRHSGSIKESNAVKSDKPQPQLKSFSHSVSASPPNALLLQASQVKGEKRQRIPTSSQLSEDGVAQNHASFNSKEFQRAAGKLNLLPSQSIGVLNEIGRRCSSKVEFRSAVSTNKDFQFSMEVLFTGEKIGVGMGRTRKDAQEQAATNALRSLAEKYVAHMDAQREAVDSEFDKHSLGGENGFLWDEVNPESSELQREDGLP